MLLYYMPAAHHPVLPPSYSPQAAAYNGQYAEELVATAVSVTTGQHASCTMAAALPCHERAHGSLQRYHVMSKHTAACMVLTTHPLPVLSACPMQNKIASTGKGILAMDESNATCGKRLESIGLENTVENRQVRATAAA